MYRLQELKDKWINEDPNYKIEQATAEDIILFETTNNIIIPKDLKFYFENLNGTNDMCDLSFFEFYSLSRMKRINDEYKDWKGIPNFNMISDTLPNYEDYFVIANYGFNMFAYCINLDSNVNPRSTVLVVCGDEYKVIANSFSDFVGLYLDESSVLYF